MVSQGDNKPSRSLKVNFLFQSSYQILLILIPLVTTPYLSRVLGAQAVGTFSFTQAVATYFVMFAMLGMSTYGVREIAAAGKNRELRTRTFWNAYASQAIIGLSASVAYVFVLLFLDYQGNSLVWLAWGLYVISAPLDVSWLLFGVEEFKVPTIRSAITKIATLPIIFGFVHGPDDLWIYCTAIAGSLLANQILIWPFIRRYVDLERPCWSQIRRHFKPSLILFVPVIAVSLYTSMDKILLGGIAGMQQAGFFEYSEKLSRMPLAVVTAMGTVMLPRMTAELTAGRREIALDLLENSVWAMLAMAFALAFGIAAIAPEFSLVFLGREFAECDSIMRVLAIVIPVVSMTNVVGKQYLVPTGRDYYFTASVCAGAVVNVITNLVLIPQYGAMGAAVATVAAEITVFMAQAWTVHAELPFGLYARNALPYLAIGLLMLGIVRIVAGFLYGLWGYTVLGLVIEIVVGIAAFAVLTLVWCSLTNDPHFKKFV